MAQDLIIATKNKGKVREIKHVLKPLGSKILSLLDLPKMPDIKETGKTFEENAVRKAKTIAKKTKELVLADDSGLEVKAMKGKPGIRSARYAGPNPTTIRLCRKLLKEMKDRKDRRARFVCVIVIAGPKKLRTVKGICSGSITLEMKGRHGFGYDPIFVPDGYNKTFAQMPLKLKNKISHRGKALQKAKAYLARFFAS
ncbi:MAG: XTP/dITP diphosphatase [bacterium]